MNTQTILIYIAVMAVVTYLIRMLPLVLFTKEIKSRYIKSFLYYVPYAVLGAMTFPAVFYSTGSFGPAVIGLMVAITAAFFNRGLVTVALLACGGVLVAGVIL